MRNAWAVLLAAAALMPASVVAQDAKPAKQTKPLPAIPLATAGLAGQTVAVLPLTMVLSDRSIPGHSGPTARSATLRYADSVFADILAERTPEVTWILPPELRRTAKRAAGLMPGPDQMGQSAMRAPNMKEMPDPLRTYVRQLVALIGGARFAFVPAALYITPAPGDSLDAQLSAVLVDARTGRVVYRTLARGRGATFADAYFAALGTILPAEAPPPPTP